MQNNADVLASLAQWIDGVFLLGLTGVGQTHRDEAARITARLEAFGLSTCAAALQSVLDANAQGGPAAFGRLVVIYELAQEACDIERLATVSPHAGDSPDGQAHSSR